MGLETATYIDDLVATNPLATDGVSQGDDHLRLLKAVTKATFPNFTRPFYHDTVEEVSGADTFTTADDRAVKAISVSGGAAAVLLPDSPAAGFEITVIKSDASGNAVTVTRSGSNTINGATTYALSTQYQGAKFKYIGGGLWLVIGTTSVASGSGDVVGPASATDNAIVRFDATTGKLIQNSVVTIADTTGTIAPVTNDSGALGTATNMWGDLFLATGGVINWNNGDVTATHSANALTFQGAASGYLFSHAVLPQTSDGAALGSTANMWADLFLAAGAVINWNNGGITVTEATDVLTFAGAASYRFDNSLFPATSDTAALGSTTLMWSDLFLAAGGVINFNNGDVTLTHTTNQLLFAGASAGYLFDAVVVPTTSDGAALGNTANMWSDLFLASGGVINFNNGNYTLTHSAGLLTGSGAFSVGTSAAITSGTHELGHASDTTLSRDSAGVLAVEGVPLYSQIPQNSQSAAYTLVLADAQKHIYHPGSDNNARTFTIPANSSVAYPIGTCLTFVNAINTVTIAITTDTMTLAGAGTTGSRTLAANGWATAMKVASTSWIISGTGLT